MHTFGQSFKRKSAVCKSILNNFIKTNITMEENQSLLELEVDKDAANNLTEVSRWGKFLGFLVCIGLGLIFLLIIFLWNKMEPILIPREDPDALSVTATRIMLIIVFLGAAAVIGILMSFLIKGANRIRLGIQNRDQLLFNSGLNSLKNYFMMYGILTLIGIFLSLLALAIQ